MSTCKVAGYDVSFPHQAYGPQLGYMYKVLKVRTTAVVRPRHPQPENPMDPPGSAS